MGLLDRTMTPPSVSFSLMGHRFGASTGWRGQEEEWCYIYRKADDGSRWHGAALFRRRARVDGYAQHGAVFWRRGGVNGRHGKVGASVPALEMDRWKTVATTFESVPDRCVT